MWRRLGSIQDEPAYSGYPQAQPLGVLCPSEAGAGAYEEIPRGHWGEAHDAREGSA